MKNYFLSLIHNNLFAERGCLKGDQVYANPPSGGWYQWQSHIADHSAGWSTTSTTYSFVNAIKSISCSIGFLGWSFG